MFVSLNLKAACFAGRGLSYSSTRAMLKRHCATIKIIGSEDITSKTFEECDVVFFPGIIGEQSPYPQLIPAEKGKILRKAIEEKGLIAVFICAAAYYAFEDIDYQGLNPMKGLGLIKGKAQGPIIRTFFSEAARQQKSDIRHSELFYITWSNGANAGETLKLVYHHGPSFIPSEQEDYNVIAKYTDPRFGAAVLHKQIGRGHIFLSSPLFEMNAQSLKGTLNDRDQNSYRKYLRSKMIDDEPARNDFQKYVFQLIAKQVRSKISMAAKLE